MVTNCHLPRALFKTVDYVIPISSDDLILTTKQVQFTTRMIYNRFPPFLYTLVLDAHTCWCADIDGEEVFQLFKASDVDLAFSTRVLNKWTTSGFAVIYRYNQATFTYWTRIMKDNMRTNFHSDDQFPMREIARLMVEEKALKFRWLSNNWFFAPHSVTEEGEFIGDANCYRSSVLVNGRVRFIHGGGDKECLLANGYNNKDVNKLRAHFSPDHCVFSHAAGPQMVFSQEQMEKLVEPHQAPKFDWTLLDNEDPDSLFWYKDKGFIY